MKFTHTLPKKPGFYWWTNFGEHTPTVLEVKKDYQTRKLYATDNMEFSFIVKKRKFDKDPDMKIDGHYYGEDMWCEIPVPTLDGKEVEPDCY
jgi:restriction endonuclease S subunit